MLERVKNQLWENVEMGVIEFQCKEIMDFKVQKNQDTHIGYMHKSDYFGCPDVLYRLNFKTTPKDSFYT